MSYFVEGRSCDISCGSFRRIYFSLRIVLGVILCLVPPNCEYLIFIFVMSESSTFTINDAEDDLESALDEEPNAASRSNPRRINELLHHRMTVQDAKSRRSLCFYERRYRCLVYLMLLCILLLNVMFYIFPFGGREAMNVLAPTLSPAQNLTTPSLLSTSTTITTSTSSPFRRFLVAYRV